MKRILLFVGTVFSLSAASSQTLPFKDFYFASPMLINPAMAGERIDPTFTLISNIPTSGIDGAPSSVTFSYDQRIEKINSGFGAMFNRETIGVHTEMKQALMYNYRWKMRSGNGLALGGSLFYKSWRSDWDKLFSSGGSVLSGVERAESLGYDLGVGYSFVRGARVGLSVINDPITYYTIDNSNSLSAIEGRTKVVAFLQQNFRINNWLKLTPSALYALPGELPAILNLNATAYIGKWVFVGAQYSNNNSHNNTSNIFAGVCYSDVIQIGVKVFEKQSPQAYGYRSAAFMLQVSPKRKSTTAM
ncbi:MAG: PorP/SprF family type IX secretion system membrane protein [Imperialibacter sp.]|uniref:PorP/SprF family type IX secretion system membrane protein n=1 Tax=Imperialibacter sp. TaxID=2038411 RepID=UPI0032EDDBC1